MECICHYVQIYLPQAEMFSLNFLTCMFCFRLGGGSEEIDRIMGRTTFIEYDIKYPILKDNGTFSLMVHYLVVFLGGKALPPAINIWKAFTAYLSAFSAALFITFERVSSSP